MTNVIIDICVFECENRDTENRDKEDGVSKSIPARRRHTSDLFLGGRLKHQRGGVRSHLGREEREKLATRENPL